MLQNKKQKFYALILILSILTSLYACTGQNNGVTFSQKGEKNYKVLQVGRIENAKEINAKLDGFFSEINDEMKKLNSEKPTAYLKYATAETDDGYIIHSWLAGTGGQKLCIPDIVLSSGGCSLPDEDFIAWLRDRAFVEKLLELSLRGLNVNLGDMEFRLTATQMYALLCAYYENATGAEIDCSGVNRDDIGDRNHLKTLAVIPNLSEYNQPSEHVESDGYIKALSGILKQLNFKLYGLSSEQLSLHDLVNILELFYKMYSIADGGETQNSDWAAFGDDIRDLSFLDEILYEEGDALSRGTLASIFSFLFDKNFPGNNDDLPNVDFSDAKDENASYCVALGLMDYFPRHAMFYPDYQSKHYELPDIAEKFMNTCFYDGAGNESGGFITQKDAVLCLVYLDEYFSGLESAGQQRTAEDEKSLIINDRDYDWYARQYGTGEYAGVNCMPTMTLMGILWADSSQELSVEDLRNSLLPEFDGGWWMLQVFSVLDEKGIDFTLEQLSKSAILAALDAGGIVLTMFSEAEPDAQGHCEVIYGYEKIGDSVRFIVHDPGHENTTRSDGNPGGKALWLDSEYIMWTIGRISTVFIKIPDAP